MFLLFCKYLKNISNFSSVHFEQFNLLKRKDKAYYFISTQDLTIGSVLFFSRLLWLKVCMYLVQSYKIDMSFFIKIMSCVLRLLIYIEKQICIPLSIFYYYWNTLTWYLNGCIFYISSFFFKHDLASFIAAQNSIFSSYFASQWTNSLLYVFLCVWWYNKLQKDATTDLTSA